MHKMSNLEYSFIINEFAPLIGKHFSRIRKIRDGLYRMKIGTFEIICEPGIRIHFTKFIEESVQNDRFSEKIEKEFDNAQLHSIEQINGDRILSFNFNRGSIIFEMFGDGNIIAQRDGIIIVAMKYESWASREIKVGLSYCPPEQKPNISIEQSDRYIIVSLMKLPFGKDYVQEILIKLGIEEKTPANKLTKNQLLSIENELELLKKNARPFLFFIDKPLDFSLCNLSKYSIYKSEERNSLSDAADEYYSNFEELDEQLVKLEKRLEKQLERLDLLLKEEKEYKEKAELIYSNFEKIELLIEQAKSGKIETDKKEKSFELVI